MLRFAEVTYPEANAPTARSAPEGLSQTRATTVYRTAMRTADTAETTKTPVTTSSRVVRAGWSKRRAGVATRKMRRLRISRAPSPSTWVRAMIHPRTTSATTTPKPYRTPVTSRLLGAVEREWNAYRGRALREWRHDPDQVQIGRASWRER